MSVTATGPQGVSLAKLAAHVAASATFAARVAAAYPTHAAAEHVHWPFALDDQHAGFELPLATIAQEAIEWNAVAGGTTQHLAPRGALVLSLAAQPAYAEQRDADLDFKNFCDGVLADLLDLSGADENLVISRIVQRVAPSFARSEQRDDRGQPLLCLASYVVHWGEWGSTA